MFYRINRRIFLPSLVLIIALLFAGCAVNTEIKAELETPEQNGETNVPKETEFPLDTEKPNSSVAPEETVSPTEENTPDSSVSWSENTHSNNVEPNYDIVFNQSEVLEFNIVIDSENWQLMQDDLKNNTSIGKNDANVNKQDNQTATTDNDPIWVTSTITFNNITWNNVGIRYKGNSSLRSVFNSGNGKFSFKLDFDEFEDEYPEINNQRFYGFKQLNLNNNFSDVTLMHEKVAADLFREFGLASSQTAFCIVNVDYGEGSQFFGVYTLVEEMDDTGIEKYFGDDSGNLYKPEGKGASFAVRSYNDEDMEKKNNEDEADYSDVVALYEVINSDIRKSDVDAWKSELEEFFNVDGFLKWLAANTVIQNWDTYGVSIHNFYLYNDPDTNQLNWIPWDNNEAFTGGKKDKTALSLGMDEVSTQWPLIRYLIDDPEYKAVYDGYLQQFVDEVFIPEKMIKTYNEYFEMIKEYAYAERTGYTFIKSDAEFNQAVEGLKTHVEQRNTAVKEYLAN